MEMGGIFSKIWSYTPPPPPPPPPLRPTIRFGRVCSTITVCTFIVGGKPHRDNMANFEKVNHRRILNIQRSNL